MAAEAEKTPGANDGLINVVAAVLVRAGKANDEGAEEEEQTLELELAVAVLVAMVDVVVGTVVLGSRACTAASARIAVAIGAAGSDPRLS